MIADHNGHNGHNPVLTAPAGSVLVGLLGEIALRRDGALSALPGARARLLLAALALAPGRSRSAQTLIDDVWAQQPPRAPMNALHTQVSRLRSALPEGALEIGPAGYRLTLPVEQVDLTAVTVLTHRARERRALGDLAGCLELIERARALWRGEPGADLPSGVIADELRGAAETRSAELDVLELAVREVSGDLGAALPLAHRRAEADPLNEPAQQTLMRLLATAGRPNEALESFATFRARLADQLGADPGRALIDLNTAILRGEPLRANGVAAVPGSGATPVERDSSSTSAEASAATQPAAQSAAVSNVRIGLRSEPNALLGRGADLDRIEELLRTARVVTVLGPGGVGKTRVAHAAGARARRLPVVLVELASVRGGGRGGDARAGVEGALGAALGVSEVPFDSQALRTGQSVDFRQRLRDALSARSMLLILDNCEHLIDEVAVVVADAIAAADRLTVLTTSRSPLMITAETVYPLAPLGIEEGGSPATELFDARARAVRPGVRLDPGIVAELCRTLDGLPLAIELAAARVRTMSVEEINRRLGDRFSLLRHGDRSSPERHRTLHAVIDWSWDLLEPAQQLALCRLCRFPAGFTLAAAEIVAEGPRIVDVAAAVDGLVNQSLLTMFDDEILGTRYRMLETVREYGEEKLDADRIESEAVDDRMLLWAKGFCTEVAERHSTDDQMRLVLAIGEEVDNLIAALRCALDREDAVAAYTVFPVLGALWVMRGSHTEVITWATRVVALELTEPELRRTVPDLVVLGCVVACLHLMYLGGIANLRAIAAMRVRLRRLLAVRGDLSESALLVARILLSRVDGTGVARLLANGAHSGDPETRSSALLMRANIRENTGDVYGSTHDADLVLGIVGTGKVWSVAMVRRHLGMVRSQVADYPGAVAHYRFALDKLHALGAYEDTVETRCSLVAALIGCGALAEARREMAIVTGSVDPVGDDPGSQYNELLSAIEHTAAELVLAEGAVEQGLLGHRRALELSGWPGTELARPDPGRRMTAASTVDAYVLYGRAGEVAQLVTELIAESVVEFGKYQDIPQIGAVACAVGSYLIASGADPTTGVELLALAPKAVARQDFPSTQWDRHRELAATALGADRMAAALAGSARMRRRHGVDRIMAILRALNNPATTA
ncbi:AfsR/SARP family transcriptional regulator [Nocardia callitridis]|uniref:BTAD domain-containing putative transcriptional regulator n=1 Tax=Nocardia callitridis TaxID=648753 RepID=A0ABP9JV09_9NOCA